MILQNITLSLGIVLILSSMMYLYAYLRVFSSYKGTPHVVLTVCFLGLFF